MHGHSNDRFDIVEPTEFSPDGKCPRCRDLGFWLTPVGIITECPKLQLKLNDHPEPNAAAQKVLWAGVHLARADKIANPICYEIARELIRHTTAEPCSRLELIRNNIHSSSGTGALREFHSRIEELRRDWKLPVASRKQSPSGYWIAVTQTDFAEWVGRAQAAPKTQLTTVFRLAKTHWPVYGEQLELDFWHDMSPEVPANFETAPISAGPLR